MQNQVVIGQFKRTPFHFANKGALAKVRPDEMIADTVKALLAETGIEPSDIEDVIIGCAFPEAEQGFNVGKIVTQIVGLPVTVAGMTVNRFCGSSMQAIHIAAGNIQMGAGELFICGGVESMSRVPMGGYNPMFNQKLMESYPQAYMSMGETAENVAKQFDVSRDDQETFAVQSHKKAAAAQKEGRFNDEIIEIAGVKTDGTIRPDTSKEALSELKPAFDKKGLVTAGTASPLTDGAVATIVCSEEYAKANDIEIVARIKSVAVAGCKAEIMGMGPINASNKALERAGVKISDIGVVELNEAFASQSLAVVRKLGIQEETLNIDGGAIALGHPLGASGGRITAKAAQIMKRQGKELALATMCIGGGQGIATVLEAV